MALHSIKLKNLATTQLLPGILNDDLGLDALFDVEAEWCTSRIGLLRTLVHQRADRALWPGSLHWNWADKAAFTLLPQLEEGMDIRFFGIKAQGRWQGLLSATGNTHATHLSSKPIVYVDYIESAPWNWTVDPLKIHGLFAGVGLHLMASAVRWSISLGYKGRLGLHSLPQARPFYSNRCAMEDFGPDPDHDDMHYFELDEKNVQAFLRT